ncbi:MAG: translesion error-prone DNA polymerase V autoproteolytic subunit [Bacteroidales bacterium]|nr:translesion error-prone DNA polymerase V autoproteolytic subunit [Bacteroidales bacterium]
MKARKITNLNTLTFYSPDTSSHIEIPLIETIKAGFPSPADDFIEVPLDLNKALIKNPSATFFARVVGNSMQDANIDHGDILIIDRSIKPSDGKIAVCFVDGEFTVKRLHIKNNECYLMPANSNFKPIKITSDNNFIIWGIVTHIIKAV